MGHVFLALTGQAGVQRVCALKVLKNLSASHDSEELTQRFFDEAKVVTKLSHENLVYVFDFGIEDRQGFLAMEYVQGKSLTEVWNRCASRRDGFAIGLSIHFITELVSGLAYATRIEGLDLVHRDISPSNVMLTYTGGLKLIDFGLAKWKSKVVQTAVGVQWGKTSYMSPEQHMGRPVDHRSDLFSAGVILWELLTGRQLFPSKESRPINKPIPPPSYFSLSVSPELDRVVNKALAMSPADRFQNGDEMAAALLAVLPPEGGSKPIAARFMNRLFEAEIREESETQQRLIESAAKLTTHSLPMISAASSVASDTQNDDTTAPENDGLIGKTLSDRYFIKRLVGEGAMGRVYEGHHTGIGKRVAIKIANRSERRKTELAKRFQREALAPAQIGHPNIADVTDCGTTPNGDFYFVMEYIDGIGLDAILRRDGKLTVERTLTIATQVCRALEAAHTAGIIHRDLKPSNVMLIRSQSDDTDLVKVLDFGVAKFLRETTDGNITSNNASIGTPRYMAPEQIRSGGTVDFRADIYAVGGILYAMLSGGQLPIEGSTIEEIWQRKLAQDPRPLRELRSDLSPELEKLVLRCLTRDPSKRPASAEELKKQLLALLEVCRTTGENVQLMRAPSQTALVERRVRGHQLTIGIAVALITAAAIALGGVSFIQKAPRQLPVRPPVPVAVPIPLPIPAPRAPIPTPAPVAPPSVVVTPARSPTPTSPLPPSPPKDTPRPKSASVKKTAVPSSASPTASALEPQPILSANDLALREESTRAAIAKAKAAFFEKNLEAARAAAQQATELATSTSSETRVRAYLILAKVQLEAGEPHLAIKTFDRILAIDPQNPIAIKGKDMAANR